MQDTDVMWLRNPTSQLSPQAEISIASDYFRGDPYDPRNLANCGFFYAKSCSQTIEFFKYWSLAKVLYPNKNEQQVFNIIKYDHYASMLSLEMRFLDTTSFSNFCKPSKDFNKVCTMHATCCVGMDRKIHDLRLVLDDWKNYTSRSEVERRSSGSFSWRVPDKCKLSNLTIYKKMEHKL